MSKIGRNAPCPCGSERKYKHCCGALNRQGGLPPGAAREIQRALQFQEAQEKVRTRQQGYGRPIISTEVNGHRIVAVSNTVYWSKNWKFFTDFLLHFLKEVLGREWGQQSSQSTAPHPVVRWFEKLGHLRRDRPSGSDSIVSSPETGFLRALFGLAYSLYLIAHNDQLPPKLLQRLRRSDDFRAATYETLVGAAFAVAGYRIECAERGHNPTRVPEFFVTAKSGKRYSVEAKCKLKWTAPIDPDDSAFAEELRSTLRSHLHKAAAKKLPNPVYWFELSIPAALDEGRWRKVVSIVTTCLREAETNLTVDGNKLLPAYVFVTNNTHLVNEDGADLPFVAQMESIHIPELNPGTLMEIEAALEARDQHREMLWVLKCMKNVTSIPQTFDGTPSELLGAGGRPVQSFKIGDLLALDMPDGTVSSGVVEEVCSVGDVAWVILRDQVTGAFNTVTMPLKPEEVRAVKRFGDAVFGKANDGEQLDPSDPLAIYDWFLDVFSEYTRDGLLNQIRTHPLFSTYSTLPTPDLLIRAAREHAKHVIGRQPAAV
jgi:hypothetical protein